MTVGCNTLKQRCGALTAVLVIIAALVLLGNVYFFEMYDGSFCRVARKQKELSNAQPCTIESCEIAYASGDIAVGLYCVYGVKCDGVSRRAVSTLDLFQRTDAGDWQCDPYRTSHIGANATVRWGDGELVGELDSPDQLELAIAAAMCDVYEYVLEPLVLLCMPVGFGALLGACVLCGFRQRRHYLFRRAQIRARLDSEFL